ncbi:NAD-dependent epimerase/dehydratase family protein [Lichenifustis flavocetrariae]|uniref:NAD(P)-dependent oxidoreductase n=1 Tax=Lichenifustis flavocetrariae TaxID=2949735 RepID=A0AA41YXX4_9HYPH|nr:NAD(P)-dependent oxidoreductase [Lichenifustis flavocetrariae]MCW6510611.1 NAD(P)-dependent oxidoreductase [Lichenifustis flavocetrariae]
MNVLLTGAAGLIGMAVRPILQGRGHQVIATDVTSFGHDVPSLTTVSFDDIAGFERLVEQHRIDAIVHCGAISGPMMAKGEPLKLVAVNIDSTAALLDLARRHGMRRFVFCSSISVYGDVGAATITEETPLRPTSVYGASKVACEQLIQGFAVEYGLQGVSLRIARVYGPYRRANCHLKTLIENTEAGRPVAIPCDPDFVYHYVYVDDVAEAIAAALEAARLPQRIYNVGSGEPLTMPALLDEALHALPRMRASLVPGVDDVPDVQTRFDVSAIGRDLAWSPRFRMNAGIAAYRSSILAGQAAP